MNKTNFILSLIYWILVTIVDAALIIYVKPAGVIFAGACGLTVLFIAAIIFWVYCWLQTFK